MRAKILFPCLLVVALCGGLLWLKNNPRLESPVAVKAPPALVKTAEVKRASSSEKFPTPVKPDATERAADLSELALRDDPAAVDEIISALADGDAEVRVAAREAAVQSGDRSLIPALQVAASRTEDVREKTALLDAVDFLQLPSLAEAQATP